MNDFYIIEEEPIEPTVDKASGLTSDVVGAIKSGKLFIPDIAQYALEKFPFRGKVVSKGNRAKLNVNVGDRVMFARLGGQRWQIGETQYLTIKECDLHAIIE